MIVHAVYKSILTYLLTYLVGLWNVCVWSIGTDQRRLEVHSARSWPVISVAVHYGLYSRHAGHHLPGADHLRRTTFNYWPVTGRHQLASSTLPVLCLHCLHHLADVLPCSGWSSDARSNRLLAESSDQLLDSAVAPGFEPSRQAARCGPGWEWEHHFINVALSLERRLVWLRDGDHYSGDGASILLLCVIRFLF